MKYITVKLTESQAKTVVKALASYARQDTKPEPEYMFYLRLIGKFIV